MIGIYSRHIVGARAHARETGPLAERTMREVWNGTIEYAPVFPERSASVVEARQLRTDFEAGYNECHHHAGLGMHTPSEVRHGRHHAVRARREAALAAARTAHLERFGTTTGLPKILHLPERVWINKADQNPEPQQQSAQLPLASSP